MFDGDPRYRQSEQTIASQRAFSAVVLDWDSNMTRGVIDPDEDNGGDVLCGAEGMDFMAYKKGVFDEVQKITNACMGSGQGFPASLRARLPLVNPTLDDVAATANEYGRSLLHGTNSLVPALESLGIEVFVVSGGIRQAIMPVAQQLGFSEKNVHAVELEFDKDGEYSGIKPSQLADHDDGKSETIKEIVAAMGIPLSKVVMVGDGGTDMRTKALGISTVLNGQVSYRSNLVEKYKPDWVVLPGLQNHAPSIVPVLLAITTVKQQEQLLRSPHASLVQEAMRSFANYIMGETNFVIGKQAERVLDLQVPATAL